MTKPIQKENLLKVIREFYEKILLVEDNNINADMLKRRFENKGFKVWIDSEAEQAIKLLVNFFLILF